MTDLQNNEMKNTYIFAFHIVVSDRDSVVTSRLCQNWNDPQYKTADGKGLHSIGVESISYADTKDTNIG